MRVQLFFSHCLVSRSRVLSPLSSPALEVGLEAGFLAKAAAAPHHQQGDQTPSTGEVGHSMRSTYWVEPLVGR